MNVLKGAQVDEPGPAVFPRHWKSGARTWARRWRSGPRCCSALIGVMPPRQEP
jgi:hypothetical protein